MSENTPTTNDLLTAFRGLQQRLLQEVVNSHAETEMTLKQLVAYLNISSQNLTEVHHIVIQFNTTIDLLKSQIENQQAKINEIEQKVTNLPNETYKIKDVMNEYFTAQNDNLNKYITQTNEYLKKLVGIMGQQNMRTAKLESSLENIVKSIEFELDKSSKNLTAIINSLITSNTKLDTKIIDAKSETSTQNAKKYEIKMKFWAKVVGILFASGGLIYTVIDMVVKSMAG